MSTSQNRVEKRIRMREEAAAARKKDKEHQRRIRAERSVNDSGDKGPSLSPEEQRNRTEYKKIAIALCQQGLPYLGLYLLFSQAAVAAAAQDHTDKNVADTAPAEKIVKDVTNITLPTEGPETWTIGNVTWMMKNGDNSNRKFSLVAGYGCEEELAALGLYDRYVRSMRSNGNKLDLTADFVNELDNPQHPNKFPVSGVFLAGEDTAAEYLFLVSGKTGTGLAVLTNESSNSSEKREQVAVEINGKMVQKYLNATKSPKITLSALDKETGKPIYANVKSEALADVLATMATMDDGSGASLVPVGPTLGKQGYVLAIGDHVNATNAEEIQKAKEDGSYFFFHAKTKHKALEFLSTLIGGGINSGQVRLNDGDWKLENPWGDKSAHVEITVKDSKVSSIQMVNERVVKAQNTKTNKTDIDFTQNPSPTEVQRTVVSNETQKAAEAQQREQVDNNSSFARFIANLRHYLP